MRYGGGGGEMATPGGRGGGDGGGRGIGIAGGRVAPEQSTYSPGTHVLLTVSDSHGAMNCGVRLIRTAYAEHGKSCGNGQGFNT